jgi:hypothetical protein
MKRWILIAVGAAAAAAALYVGGAAGARGGGMSSANHWRTALTPAPSRALQGSEQFQCSPAFGTPVNNDMEQTCVIKGSSGTCIEKSDSPVVMQTCTFIQTGPGDNRATAVQVVAVENGGLPVDSTVTQHARQTVNDTQTAPLGSSNYLNVTQVIKQSLGPGHFDDTEEAELDPDTSTHQGALSLSQESHQIVMGTQDAPGAGGNNSSISQSLRQRERAVHATVSIDENQNTMTATGDDVCPITDDPNSNMCAQVHQTSGTGPNASNLDQNYSQFERAHDTPTGNQKQGVAPSTGGANHEVQQTTIGGVCTIKTNQDEDQTQRAVRATVNQIQNGPTRKGADSFQANTCSPNSTWTGSQNSTQLATTRPTEADVDTNVFADPATQNNLLEYFGMTPGSIHATQSVSEKVNNQSTTQSNSCSSSPCTALIVCGQAQAGDEGAGGCATDCEEGFFFNPESGRCEFSDLVFDSAPASRLR